MTVVVTMVALVLVCPAVNAQYAPNDTIRLGAIEENGRVYPAAFLPECYIGGLYVSNEDRIRRDRLRRDIYVVYPYAITAARILNEVHGNLSDMDSRRERRKYLKQVDKQLDRAFKDPLKNLSVDQGHVLIKLINRQTGQNCYSIIREMKGGVSAVVWQSVGVLFNNNLRRSYDPDGSDREMEEMVQILEASSNYRYQLYMQDELMKNVTSVAPAKRY